MSFSIPEGYSHSDNIVKSFNFIVSCFSYVFSQVWIYVLDPLISLFTGILQNSYFSVGKTKAVRILCGPMHNSKMTSQIRDCIMDKSEFTEVLVSLLLDCRFVKFFNVVRNLILIL